MHIDEMLLISESKIIACDNKYLLYNPGNRQLCEADKLIVDILSIMHNSISREDISGILQAQYPEETIESGIKELLALGYIKYKSDSSYEKRVSDSLPDFVPNNICLNITHNCNLNCIYCYGNGGMYNSKGAQMSKKTAFKTIDWMLNAVKVNNKPCSIVFFGGEPLLNFDLIIDIVKYVNDTISNDQKKRIVDFGITTNGTLINEDVTKKLIELGIRPMISIDGDPDTQNKNRPYKDGSASYKSVIEGAQIYSRLSKSKLTARVTATNFAFLETILHLRKAGFGNVIISKCTGAHGSIFHNKKGLDQYIASTKKMYEYMYKEIIIDNNTNLKVLNSSFISYIDQIATMKANPWTCGAARSYCGISPNGTIYPCHRFVDNDDFTLGTIFDNDLSKNKVSHDFIEKGIQRTGKCKDCWIRTICAGGCYHDNLITTNDPYKTDHYTCETTKRLYELNIQYYYKITQSRPDVIKKIIELKNHACGL